MKKLYSLLLLLVVSVSFGQTIYSENFGTPTGSTTVANYITGVAPATFQNSSPIAYSGTTGATSVRITSPSSVYSGASGNGNVFLSQTTNLGHFFQIDGINTSAYSASTLQLSFGYNTSSTTSAQLTLEQSTNGGTTWTPITFTPSGTGWTLVTVTGSQIPSSTTLSLRFTQPSTVAVPNTAQFRIDDLKVFNNNPSCTLVLGTPAGVCDAVTSGIDTYTATIPYTGGGSGTYTITPSTGTVSGGDNPNSVAAGNIIITGITEGTNLTLTIVNGVCSYSASLIAPVCKPINTLPYSEPFPYSVGSALGSSQKWINVNSGDDILSATGSLNYPGYTSSGNSVTFTGAGIDCFTPFTDTTTGAIYASFLVNVTDLSTMTATVPSTYFAGLTNALQSYKERLFITKNGTQYQFGLDVAGTTTNLDTTLRNAGDVVLIIMSYDFTAMTLSAWINPDLSTFSTATPATLTQVLTSTTAIADLGGFILRQDTATTTPTIIFDELRISTAITDLLSSNQVSTIPGLKVYPNPVSNGTLFIESDANAERNITIFDVLGKEVLNTTTSNTAINVSALHSGVYMVKVTEEGKTATKKLIIR